MHLATIKRWAAHYAYGLFAKSFNGAIAGVYGFLGLAGGSALDPEHVSAPSWRTALYIFGVSFVLSALGYFKDNPLPSRLPQTTAPFASFGPGAASNGVPVAGGAYGKSDPSQEVINPPGHHSLQ